MKQNIISKRYILLYALIAGFLMSLTPFSLAFLPSRHGSSNQSIQLLDAFLILFLNIFVFYSSLWLNLTIVETKKTRKFLINFLVYILLITLVIFVHTPVWSMIERLPIGFIIRDEIIRNLIIFSISALVANAFYSFQQNQLMKTKISEIQRQSLAGQIESLKQQINPHFFFNSLNTLSGLAQEDSQKTVDFIEKLSQVFRYVLEIQERNMVSVKEEIDFAKAYIYLLKVRFDEKFIIDIQSDMDSEVFVPSLCTQLLLENCFKHNSMSTQNPLTIKIVAENGYLVICNSLSQMSTTYGNGIGLKNLNERSKLLTGKAIEITTDNNCFTVKVPTTKKNEYNIN